MGKRSLHGFEDRKLNFGKVFGVIFSIIFIIVLIIFAVKGINNLSNDKNKDKENSNEDILSQDVIEEPKRTIEEIVNDFGGEIREKVKEDTYYISKDGKDYTAYLDGEIIEGKNIPWDGKEATPTAPYNPTYSSFFKRAATFSP